MSDMKKIRARSPVTVFYNKPGARMADSLELKNGENLVPSFLWAELLKKPAVQQYLEARVLMEVSDSTPPDERIEIPLAQQAAEEYGRTGDAAGALETVRQRNKRG